MAERSPQVASSASGVLSRSAGPSAALQAVSRVADEFGDAEIEPGISMQEALSDPNTRAQAARWRSGPEPRRATAILARMMQSLQSVRPSWTEALVAGELPVAEPLPVRRAGSSEALSWWRSSMNFCLFSTWGLRRSWRTWCLVAVILIFPKVLALLLTLVVRMVFRAGLVVIGRFFSEMGRECQGVLHQFAVASTAVENWFVDMVDGVILLPQQQQATFGDGMQTPSSSSPSTSQNMGACPQPSTPWPFFTTILLLVDLALHHRHRGGAV